MYMLLGMACEGERKGGLEGDSDLFRSPPVENRAELAALSPVGSTNTDLQGNEEFKERIRGKGVGLRGNKRERTQAYSLPRSSSRSRTCLRSTSWKP